MGRSRLPAHIRAMLPLSPATAPKRPTPVSEAISSLSEREFQSYVLEALHRRGWLTFVIPDMRRTNAGWPDVVALHAGRHVMLAWELKGEHTRVTPIQRAVITLLQDIPGVDARIIRPSMWPAVLEDLDR